VKAEDPNHRPTISDVAAIAGVSRATVSRVVNGGHWVAPETEAKVEAAIEQTGYSANRHARSLASGRSNSVALVLVESEHSLFADPVFEPILRGVAHNLAEHDLVMGLMLAGADKDRTRLESYITTGHFDGVVLVSPHTSSAGLIQRLAKSHVPTVICGAPMGYGGKISYVSADDRDGARQAVRYLQQRGCQAIATVAGPGDLPGGRDRLDGYRDVVGSAYDAALVVEVARFAREDGRTAAAELLDRGVSFDGLFAASDLLAAGVMDEFERRGVLVPDDVAVVGFDDSPVALETRPPLTTMAQPFDRIAREMIRVLLASIDGDASMTVTLPTTLVRRGSA
jgi:DNA-binding LacI/PurR family transcriptional regulator